MKISERGQLTIPKQLRDRLGFYKDVDVEVEILPKEGALLIRKRTGGQHPVDKLLGILKRPSETDPYIAKLRGE